MKARDFLAHPGAWHIGGTLWDSHNAANPVLGEALVNPTSRQWSLLLRMERGPGDRDTIHHHYAIKPWQPGSRFTPWNSHNPVIGALRGHFIEVDDLLIAPFDSVDGQYSGEEIFRRVDADHYHLRAALRLAGTVVATWAVTLTRVEKPVTPIGASSNS